MTGGVEARIAIAAKAGTELINNGRCLQRQRPFLFIDGDFGVGLSGEAAYINTNIFLYPKFKFNV
jgi:hypothetical protein